MGYINTGKKANAKLRSPVGIALAKGLLIEPTVFADL